MNKIEIELYYREWQEAKERLLKEISMKEPVRRIVSALALPKKYTGSFALIPANFDLDRHLERFPVTDYFFVRDESGHIKAVNQNGTLGYYFDKERLVHIIGLISSIPAGNRDLVTDNGYVPINSSVLRNYFKDYFSYLDYLLQTGVLITDGIFVPEEKSYGYKFSPEYENQPMVRYIYLAARDVHPEPVLEERFNRHTGKFEHNPLLDYPYLSYWYRQMKLGINPAAEDFAWHRRTTAYRGNSDKDPQAQYQSALCNIMALENKEYKAQIDSNVHRLHSAITNIQKDYRNFLKYDGQELIATDISNSQPFLLCILFNPDFWDKDSDAYINIGHLPVNIQSRFSDELLDEIKTYVASIPEDSKSEYIIKASSGEVYEFMMDKANGQYPGCCKDKKDAKIMMLTAFFSSNRFLNQKGAHLKKVFSETFPEIYELIKMSKVNDKSDFACLLQAVESEIILHRCCKRIWDEGGHRVPVFTIHDSIATTAENVKFVRNIMDEELTRAAGVHPHFKTELWSESNLMTDN